MSQIKSLLDKIRQYVPEVPPKEVLSHKLTIIDVRDQEERNLGMIPEAKGLGRDFLELRISEIEPDLEKELLIYCAGGTRSLLAAKSLRDLGYLNVKSLAGGFEAWKTSGGDIEIPPQQESQFFQRYQKHLILPELGEEGQVLLGKAKILIVGAGGLGSPNIAYLAAAGVGTIGLIDDDKVEIGNLQRQVIHRNYELGMHKVESAARFIRELNPDIKVQIFQERLLPTNIRKIIEPFDLIIDGTDNFITRYLINDCCVSLGKIHIHGAIFRFHGEVTVFAPHLKDNAPCYRCLFPEAPPPALAPSCSEAGVLGVLPGIIGTIQAHEAIKMILSLANPLIGRLLKFDGLKSRFHEIALAKDPDCPACSKQ